MRVLDLFSGLKGFSDPFADRGHEVVTVDSDGRFKPTIVSDVRKLRYPSLPPLDRPFDVVLASPPCEMFSLARSFKGWPPPWDRTAEALGIVAQTLHLIAVIAPRFWVMENPHGRLSLEFMGPPAQTVHLCNFGAKWMKPTDLWGRFPKLKNPWPCAPHEHSWTDDREGSKRRFANSALAKVRDPAIRAKLPYGLGEELCKRMEEVLQTT